MSAVEPCLTAEADRNAEREVVAFHELIEAWLRGETEPGRDAFDPIARALDPGFAIVSPDGVETERQAIAERLFGAHGASADSGLRIRIAAFTVRHRLDGGVVLATYEEHQETPAAPTCRVASAVLAEDPTTPRGMRWLHVHETWVSPPA